MKNTNSGQSLIELIIALAIGGIFITAATSAVYLIIKSSAETKTNQIATSLAQGLFDDVSVIAENDWLKLYNQNKGADIRYRISNFQWMQTYDGGASQYSVGTGVALDSNDNIYITGYQEINGGDMFLIKYDSIGNFQWMQTYNSGPGQSDQGNGVALDSNDNIYVTGYQQTNGSDMFLRKYNSNGNFQWMQTYNSGSGQSDQGAGVALDSGNNVYVTGFQGTNNDDMFLIKYNSDGVFQWMQTYNSGPGQYDEGSGVALDSNDNIYVTGYQQTNGNDMFLRKYNSNGNFQWMQTYNSGGNQSDGGIDVALDSNDNIYITGYQATNGNDMFLRKYNSDGVFQWIQIYGSSVSQSDAGIGVALDSNDNVYVTGYQATNYNDMFLRKYDSNGNFQWLQTYNSSAGWSDFGTSVALDSGNNVYVTGVQETDNYDMFLRKYGNSFIVRNIINGEEVIDIEGKEYSRYFSIENVNRDSCGIGDITSNSATICNMEGGSSYVAEDPSTQKITIKVEWEGNRSLTKTGYLTRRQNFNFKQSDWSAGPGQEFFSTSTGATIINNKFTASTNISSFGGNNGYIQQTSVLIDAELTSSVFEFLSQSIGQKSAAINTISWLGNLNGNPSASVKFQIAATSSPNGPWNYKGPDGTSGSYYNTSGPSAVIPVNLQYNNNYRYFRYKIFISSTQPSGPRVDEINISWSP